MNKINFVCAIAFALVAFFFLVCLRNASCGFDAVINLLMLSLAGVCSIWFFLNNCEE